MAFNPSKITLEAGSRLVPIAGLNITATVAGSAQTFYTCSERGITTIDRIVVRNDTGTAATITFNSIPSGDSIGAANEELGAYNIPANTTLPIHGLLNHAHPPSSVFKVFSGTNGALYIFGTVKEWK